MTGVALKKKIIKIIQDNSYYLEPLDTGKSKNIKEPIIIKSIIFDIYGTLLISASGDIGTVDGFSKTDIFIKSLKMAGINVCNSKAGIKGIKYFYDGIQQSHLLSKNNNIEYPEVIITKIWKNTLALLLKDKLINTEISNSIIFKTATYFEILTNPVWPMPNFLKVIDILQKKKIFTGIVSNAQFYTSLTFKALTSFSLNEIGFKKDLIKYSYMNKEAKPSLKMFKSIILNLKNNYNIAPEHTLYIGNDMLNDVYSANKAGLKTVLFAGDARSLKLRENESRIMGLNPDFVITDLMQIPELIK